MKDFMQTSFSYMKEFMQDKWTPRIISNTASGFHYTGTTWTRIEINCGNFVEISVNLYQLCINLQPSGIGGRVIGTVHLSVHASVCLCCNFWTGLSRTSILSVLLDVNEPRSSLKVKVIGNHLFSAQREVWRLSNSSFLSYFNRISIQFSVCIKVMDTACVGLKVKVKGSDWVMESDQCQRQMSESR